MPCPVANLLRAAAVIALLGGTAACEVDQRDLGAISGVPDTRLGGDRGAPVYGTLSTGGHVVFTRELPQ
ncbi:MAG TPA: hypothetical protein VD970_19995 [Acetobacteraceae bacterium]|nr:hypothetical protein [Acetobacteraceae bacterium]